MQMGSRSRFGSVLALVRIRSDAGSDPLASRSHVFASCSLLFASALAVSCWGRVCRSHRAGIFVSVRKGWMRMVARFGRELVLELVHLCAYVSLSFWG